MTGSKARPFLKMNTPRNRILVKFTGNVADFRWMILRLLYATEKGTRPLGTRPIVGSGKPSNNTYPKGRVHNGRVPTGIGRFEIFQIYYRTFAAVTLNL